MSNQLKSLRVDNTFSNVSKVIILPYEENDFIKIYCGNTLKELDKIGFNSIDCIIMDPPYFLDKMDDDWDKKRLEFCSNKSKSYRWIANWDEIRSKTRY